MVTPERNQQLIPLLLKRTNMILCLFPPEDTEKTVPPLHMGQATHIAKTRQQVATGSGKALP